MFLKRIMSFSLGIVFSSALFAQSRQVDSFNDNWQFYKATNSTFFSDFDNGADYFESKGQWTKVDVFEKVNLPHTYNKDDMQLSRDFYEGKAIYKKSFNISPIQRDKRLFLKFEGVGSVAQLYVNNKYIGEHKGAYSMFVFEITQSIDLDKENEIVLVTDNRARKDVLPVNQFLFPIYGGHLQTCTSYCNE